MIDRGMIKKEDWLGMGAGSPEQAKVCMMGIPYDGGSLLGKGAVEAPRKIRDLARRFMPEGTDSWCPIEKNDLYDFGDLIVDETYAATYVNAENAGYKVMQQGKLSVFVGGDHSMTIPLHKAYAKYQREKDPDAKIGIIHFDAHLDLAESFEGRHWSHSSTARHALNDVIKPEDLFFVGVRAAEKEELEMLKENPEIGMISAMQIFTKGYPNAFKEIAMRYRKYDSIYLTIDIDVLDPASAPGTGTPAPGGITTQGLIYLVEKIMEMLPVHAMDIMEISPPLDINDITSWAGMRLLQEAIASTKEPVYSDGKKDYGK